MWTNRATPPPDAIAAAKARIVAQRVMWRRKGIAMVRR
jgi:hypothetical protein